MKKPEDNITYGDEGGVDAVRKYHDVQVGMIRKDGGTMVWGLNPGVRPQREPTS